MPGTDGIELLRFLSAERSRARILLMSGFDARIREAALLLGEAHALDMVGIVAKPVRAAELRALLASLETPEARQRLVLEKSVSVRVDLGGLGIINKNTQTNTTNLNS